MVKIILPAIIRLSQEDNEFKANLDYISRPCFKNQNKQTNKNIYIYTLHIYIHIYMYHIHTYIYLTECIPYFFSLYK
jgi:hypothetical protein